ncbi:MAG: hypothetical protein WAW11_00020 [Patescibacteria group bacterium]
MEMNAEKIQKIINGLDEIVLEVDYTKTVDQAVSESSCYLSDDKINDVNFPISPDMVGKKINANAKLFCFNHDVSVEDVLVGMDNAGYRPAYLMELLALAALHSKLQTQYPVVAFGSIWRTEGGRNHVTYLSARRNRRVLACISIAGVWLSDCRFLAIRK